MDVLILVLLLCSIGFNIYAWRKIMAQTEELQAATSNEISKLESEVAETGSVMQSAVVLLQGLKARLDDALNSGNITDRIVALSKELDTQQQSLADAILANTPAEDELPEDGEEVEEPEGDSSLSNDATREPSNGNPVHGVDDSDLRPRP